MRKLGRGHKVSFWASTEVDESIKSFHTGTITAKEVLLWSIRNNHQQIKDGFVHWASAGVYVAQKLSRLVPCPFSLFTCRSFCHSNLISFNL